jgi:peptidyl-dipeptidase Dcp
MSTPEALELQETATSSKAFDASNPFFAPSTLPFSAPPFDLIRDEHYMPAFEAGMAEGRAEVDAIVANPEAPTFENTLIALEKGGALLSRVASAFYAIAGAHTNPTLQQLQQDVAPKLSAHSDAIHLDERLFGRVKTLYDKRESLKLDAESLRLLEITYDGFVKSGALLSEPSKNTLMALNT